MKYKILKILVLSVLTMFNMEFVKGSEACEGTSCSESLKILGTNAEIELFRNYSLQSRNEQVVKAIIVIHGAERNATEYLATLQSATKMVNKVDSTLIIAPRFLLDTDLRGQNVLYWNELTASWIKGAASVGPSQVSSYTVMDQLIKAVALNSNFPNIREIIVTGHSAGGQLTLRYAAGGNLDNQGINGIRFRYIPVNPNVFMYLDRKRPLFSGASQFAVPNVSQCPDFNWYKYGLEKRYRYPYMNRVSAKRLISQFTQREVIYLQGTADTLADGLDTSCAAMLQGKNRYERAISFSSYIKQFFPKSPHTLVEVFGVGHMRNSMYQSAASLKILFDEF